MFQKFLSHVLIALIAVIGLIVISFPFTSGENAYYVNDNLFLSIKDSVDMGYKPYLKSILQQKQSALAFQEKKKFREQYKSSIDSLNAASLDAKINNKAVARKKTNLALNALNELISNKEFEIDEKYSIGAIEKSTYETQLREIESAVSLMDYVVAVANEQINTGDSNQLEASNISIGKVNKQNKSPFLLSGFFIVACAVFLLFYQSGKIPLDKPAVKISAFSVLLLFSILMLFKIYGTFSDRISFDKTLSNRETIVKNKLLDIRTAELYYLEANNKYCNDWDELIRFYKEDSIKIVKYLVNKNDTAAVNLAIKNGEALEQIEMVPALNKAFPNRKIKLDNLPFVPFSNNPFELNAGVIDKNGRNIHVFEVKTTKYEFVKELLTLPENFDKSKSLIVGSMREPTTEGNW